MSAASPSAAGPTPPPAAAAGTAGGPPATAPGRSPRLRPVDDYVAVRRDAQAEFSAGEAGVPVALAACARELPTLGVVLAVGPGRLLPLGGRAPVSVAPGDRVLFWRLAGQTVPLADRAEVSLLREDEILAVIDE